MAIDQCHEYHEFRMALPDWFVIGLIFNIHGYVHTMVCLSSHLFQVPRQNNVTCLDKDGPHFVTSLDAMFQCIAAIRVSQYCQYLTTTAAPES